MHILELPTYAERDGSWKQLTPEELVKFIGLLIYMDIVHVPRIYQNDAERKKKTAASATRNAKLKKKKCPLVKAVVCTCASRKRETASPHGTSGEAVPGLQYF